MPKRKLLSEMSDRHYRRLKCNARNIASGSKMSNLSKDFAEIDGPQNLSDVTAHEITDINRDVDQATNVELRNEPSRQYNDILDNEIVACDLDHNSSNLENLCPTALIFNNEKNAISTSMSGVLSIKEDLKNWAGEHQVTHTVVTGLLSVLRKHGFENRLPKNSKTLMKTPRYTFIRKVAPGEYFHNGLRSGIMAFLQKSQDDIDSVQVQISTDGLPISKSSTNQLWPILGSVIPSLSDIFIIGCYFGSKKPYNCNDFLNDFVEEAKILVTEGLEFRGKHISVSIHSLIADAPAKSFVTATKGHTGYYSCGKCTTEGEYIDGRMCFPDINCRKRTNESFPKQTQIEIHGTHNAGPILPGTRSPQYSKFSTTDFTLSVHKPDNCCGLNDGSIVIIENIATSGVNDLCIIGRKFIGLSNLYTEPCNSSSLGIYKSEDCEDLSAWPLTSVTTKYVKLDYYNTFVLLPLLHI